MPEIGTSASPLPPATEAMTMLAAAVVVHDHATDSVVLLQRGPRAKFAPGMWDLPVGKCDPGEPVTQTAVRELREETGLVVDPADLRLGHVVHAAQGAEAPNGFVTVIFLTERWRGELINAEPSKHQHVRWVRTDAIPRDIVFQADHILTAMLSGTTGITLHGWQ